MSPGRALLVSENLSVPFDRRVWQEARALSEAGHEVVVICPKGEKRDRESFELREDVAIHRFPLAFARGSLGYVREYATAMWRIRRLALRLEREKSFDVVHVANPPDLLAPAVRRLKRRGTRLIYDQHDLVPELYESRFGRRRDAAWRALKALERLSFSLADVVIATNDSYREVALTRGRKRPEDVFVVRNAPDLTRFQPTAPEPDLKRGKEHLIGYLGVMGPQDGVDHALRALAELGRHRSDWHAIFIGEGDVWEDMKMLAGQLGLNGSVQFTGRIPDPDVLRILSTADVCLAPDPKNPLNDVSTMSKIGEYMAMARPIVSYDLKEAHVSAGEAAVYAPVNDVGGFARCIEDLLDDPERRARMGALGRSRLERMFSWEHSKRALLAAYERALS